MELKGNKYFVLFLAFFLALASHVAYTQGLNESDWDELKKELEFKDPEQKQSNQTETKELPEAGGSFNWGPTVNIVVICIVALVIIFVILRLLGLKSLNNKVKSTNAHFKISNIEDDIELKDLLPLHEQLIASGDYKGAVRVLYLQSIKHLNDAGAIEWKKDKTNADYLREMRKQSSFGLFKLLTHTYELVWYGEFPVTEKAYQTVKQQFETLSSFKLNG